MPIYRITAPLIEYCKKLQNVKITIRNAQVVGSSPIPSSILRIPARWLVEPPGGDLSVYTITGMINGGCIVCSPRYFISTRQELPL